MHYGTTTLPHLPRNNTAGKINIHHPDFTPQHFINSANDLSHTNFIKITFHSSLHFSFAKVTGSIPDGVTGIFRTLHPSSALLPWGQLGLSL